MGTACHNLPVLRSTDSCTSVSPLLCEIPTLFLTVHGLTGKNTCMCFSEEGNNH